jgi:hypothetical protein
MHDKQLAVRIPVKAWEILKREGVARGLTLSGVLRLAILEHITREQAAVAEILRSMPIIEAPGVGFAKLHGELESTH